MKSLDDLLFEREKLTELIRYAELFGDNISLGSELLSLEKLKALLSDIQIEIETERSQMNLKVINNNYGSN
jgi:hypothetical protein